VKTLVWHEQHESAHVSINREKQVEKWDRAWKIRLIEDANPYWNDLYGEITR
jgi:putative endonuclease